MKTIVHWLLVSLFVPAAVAQVESKERVIAGSADDFMKVVHLRLAGSNVEIGAWLAELAQKRFGVQPRRSLDPSRTRAQQIYYERNYPIFLQRMRGVAAAFGHALTDTSLEFGDLSYSPPTPGCSVVFFPKQTTADGRAVLSRYFDFSTGNLRGQVPAKGLLPDTARPILLELHPDQGYASLAMVSYDLLGALDGMNSAGLCVALLADDEFMAQGVEPNTAVRSGLGVLGAVRMLLDTCKNVEEAKVALLSHKHYYESIPCHYIVCDRAGRSFVWEHSRMRNREHIIDGGGDYQIVTNFMQQRYGAAGTAVTSGKPALKVPAKFGRFHALGKRVRESKAKFTRSQIRDLHSCVAAVGGFATPSQPRGRTLWHALYLPEDRAIEIDFYLGEAPGGVRRSAVHRVELRQ